MRLFTYGSLMFADVWDRIVGRSFATSPAELHGFDIFRVRGATYPGIVAAASTSRVAGIVYHRLDDPTLLRIDEFESEFYRRQRVHVVDASGQCLPCWAYVVPAQSAELLSEDRWTASWFEQHGLTEFLARYPGFAS